MLRRNKLFGNLKWNGNDNQGTATIAFDIEGASQKRTAFAHTRQADTLAAIGRKSQRVGRNTFTVVLYPDDLRRLRSEGASLRQIAVKLGIGYGTVRLRLRRALGACTPASDSTSE